MSKKEVLETKVENLDDKTSLDKLRKFKNLYVASKPQGDSFKELAKLGIKKVINIKKPEESLPNEAELAKDAGLEYVNIPVEGCRALDIGLVRQLNAEVGYLNEGPICIYCASGNRVSSWFANHLYIGHNFTIDEAIDKAKEIGMDKEPIEEGTREILAKYE
jgi:uncharacterized protein (TIGR01244 family)